MKNKRRRKERRREGRKKELNKGKRKKEPKNSFKVLISKTALTWE
jgi:hypothetical protein